MDAAAPSACTVAELPALLGEIDAEFILRKGRAGGLGTRFPRLFAADNLEHVHVARAGGAVVAAAASQGFTYVEGGRRWRCASVGAVWTHPSFRGKGLASSVMRSLAAAHEVEGTQALVLWTSIHPFYAALGWRLDDVGVFGTATQLAERAAIAPRPVEECDIEALEQLRARHLGRFVERSAVDWRAVPVPATSVEAFISAGAYALVGVNHGAGYLYELVGEQASFAEIWSSVRARYERIFVNESSGGTARWLAEEGGVEFKPQQLAMWSPLAAEAEALAGRLYIPYLDRI